MQVAQNISYDGASNARLRRTRPLLSSSAPRKFPLKYAKVKRGRERWLAYVIISKKGTVRWPTPAKSYAYLVNMFGTPITKVVRAAIDRRHRAKALTSKIKSFLLKLFYLVLVSLVAYTLRLAFVPIKHKAELDNTKWV